MDSEKTTDWKQTKQQKTEKWIIIVGSVPSDFISSDHIICRICNEKFGRAKKESSAEVVLRTTSVAMACAKLGIIIGSPLKLLYWSPEYSLRTVETNFLVLDLYFILP